MTPPMITEFNTVSPLFQGMDGEAGDVAFQQTAGEFEAMLTANILKEGLKSAMALNPDSESGANGTYMEMAYEQLAYFIGRQGLLGLTPHIAKNATTPGYQK